MSPFFKSCSDVQHRQTSPTCLVDSLGPGFNLVNIVQWHRFQLIQGKGGAKNGTPSFVLDSVFVKTTYFYYSYTLAFDTLYSLESWLVHGRVVSILYLCFINAMHSKLILRIS